MKENQITAAHGKLQCHSYDGAGFGILRSWTLDELSDEKDSIQFTLNNSEYQLLNMFDEIDMIKKGNTIVCKQNKSKFQLQDMAEANPYRPMIQDVAPLNASLEHIQTASTFVGTKDNCKGVIIGPEGIYGTDGGSLYYRKENTGIHSSIMLPVECFKMMDKNVSYSILSNQSHAVYSAPGEMIYTPIYTFCVDVGRLKKGNTYPVQMNIEQFKFELKRASCFGEGVDIIIENGQLLIKTANAINGTVSYETSLDCTTQIKEMCLHFDVKRMLKALHAIESDILSFGGTLMVVGNDDEFAMTICMSAPNHKKAVV